MNAIFVYGLLKPGERLHYLVEPFVVRSVAATTRGRLYDAGVPAARFDEDGEIEGFVFWLDPDRLDQALRTLDDLEDEGEVYERVVLEATTADGIVEAYAYHYIQPLNGCREVGRTWPARRPSMSD
jgi:gamma-glutamylcyclotransferase (GGCT)/AIG2-like uncharacterized protein YtfP